MLKQIIFLIVVSLLAIFFMRDVSVCLVYLGKAHHYLTKELAVVFAGGAVGMMIRQVVVLVVIPVIVGLIPGSIYWVIKRKRMPYLFHIIWIVWLILMTSIILHR